MKFYKKCLLILVLVFILFIFVESNRLKNNNDLKPLVVIDEYSLGNNRVAYQSIGFTLKNQYAKLKESDEVYCIGQDFYLFNKFLIWGWIY